MARGVRLSATPAAATSTIAPARDARATATWLGIAAVLVVGSLLARSVPITALDWQPALGRIEPWRAWTAVFVHYSALHLAANTAGAALVAALGAAARTPRAGAVAWLIAWPLTQAGLWLRPDLVHYGGLSGVLHAGAAIVAVYLVASDEGARRAIGVALAAGLVAKVLLEAPWGPALRHPAGWDIATAPFAHATGLVAGIACALVAHAVARRRRGSRDAA